MNEVYVVNERPYLICGYLYMIPLCIMFHQFSLYEKVLSPKTNKTHKTLKIQRRKFLFCGINSTSLPLKKEHFSFQLTEESCYMNVWLLLFKKSIQMCAEKRIWNK
jgi:hypothetical protein